MTNKKGTGYPPDLDAKTLRYVARALDRSCRGYRKAVNRPSITMREADQCQAVADFVADARRQLRDLATDIERAS